MAQPKAKRVTIADVLEEDQLAAQTKLLKTLGEVPAMHEGESVLEQLFYYPSLVEICIAKGIDVNEKDDDGNTALMLMASFNGIGASHMKSIKMVIDAKADLDAQNDEKETALSSAILSENFKVAKLLLEAGANPNLPNADGRAVLEEMFTWGKTDDASALAIAKLLAESKRLDPNVVKKARDAATKGGMTATATFLGKLA